MGLRPPAKREGKEAMGAGTCPGKGVIFLGERLGEHPVPGVNLQGVYLGRNLTYFPASPIMLKREVAVPVP
jgi:hypothetical protein